MGTTYEDAYRLNELFDSFVDLIPARYYLSNEPEENLRYMKQDERAKKKMVGGNA